MTFSADLRRKAAPMWDAEKQHPFVVGIGDGTLPLDSFRYYMQQDYVFLVDFCRVIAMGAAKAQDIADMGWFSRLLDQTLNTEMSLHIGFCKDFGITEEDLKKTIPSPTTVAYTNHLLESAYSGGVGETAAAILPCSWGYAEIGQMLHHREFIIDQPLYTRWIEMYSTSEFADLATWLRSFVDRLAVMTGADGRGRMEEVFLASSRYEYMFWDAAYRMEVWPI